MTRGRRWPERPGRTNLGLGETPGNSALSENRPGGTVKAGIVSAVETARLSPLEPLAKAYQRAVPEHPADDGLFGPRSMVWRGNRDRGFPLAGMGAPMVPALPPLPMAGRAPPNTLPRTPVGAR